MLIAFHGKGFEADLVDWTRTRSMEMGMPGQAARVCEPAAEVGQVEVALGPKHKMPMIRHQHEGQDPHRTFIERFRQHAKKRRVVGRFFKQGQARHSAIEDMVNDASRSLSRTSAHAGDGKTLALGCQRKTNEKRPASSFSFSFPFPWRGGPGG